ncbi:MAG: EAL domain-containing protein [Spirochaetes bacterium]|nr:EAL domain-containing protein [Spirochaetota bacterium]
MSVRKKAFIIIFSAVLFVFILLTVVSQFILERGFRTLENQNVVSCLNRIVRSVELRLERVQDTISHWSRHDDIYNGLLRRDTAMLSEKINVALLDEMNINDIMLVDTNGVLVAGQGYDWERRIFMPVPAALKTAVSNGSILVNIEKSVRGILMLPEGPMLVVTLPIRGGNKRNAAAGTMIAGRYFDTNELASLEREIQMPLRLYRCDSGTIPDDVACLCELSMKGQATITRALNERTFAGYTIMQDVYGAQAFVLRVAASREIYTGGRRTMWYLTLMIFAMAIISEIIFFIILERVILVRLGRLTTQMQAVTRERNPEHRIVMDGRDEFFTLATIINDMLATLAQSHSDLECRVQERTRELQETNTKLADEIAAHQKAQKELVHLAYHDPLTDFPNRLLFNNLLSQALLVARRAKVSLAVAMLDLDRFKEVNSTFGHTIGDLFIVAVARRIREAVRESDVVARMSGDEFAFIFNEVADTAAATLLGNKLLKAFQKPFVVHGEEMYLTSSIGMCLFPADGDSAEMLTRYAGTAMARAKAQGRNNCQLFSSEMARDISERKQFESGLHRAIDRGEFLVYYQPQIDIISGEIVGAEALVRWKHPEQGLIMPDKFIPIAEETGLIVPIGDIVLKNACQEVKRWQRETGKTLRVSVNISARQFIASNLKERIVATLQEAGVPPELLVLEITESTAMLNIVNTVAVLEELAAIGVQLAIDDFGVGYSSFNYLKQFRIHTIKIDKSFVQNLDRNTNDSAIVTAIIAMTKSFRVKVLAEGVENEAHLAFLRQHECDEIQGYLMSKPLPADEFSMYLKNFKK